MHRGRGVRGGVDTEREVRLLGSRQEKIALPNGWRETDSSASSTNPSFGASGDPPRGRQTPAARRPHHDLDNPDRRPPVRHDYGDARYAREDVREALTEAKTTGITPFCITVDRESESELKDLYGDVGYTIIDDVLSLPERMPNIYKRLTS